MAGYAAQIPVPRIAGRLSLVRARHSKLQVTPATSPMPRCRMSLPEHRIVMDEDVTEAEVEPRDKEGNGS